MVRVVNRLLISLPVEAGEVPFLVRVDRIIIEPGRLIVTTIETGMITAGFALLTLVLFRVFPDGYYFLTA
jgi:hypothetical protein